jgi:hypothetical protein
MRYLAVLLFLTVVSTAFSAENPSQAISWKKTVLDERFRSEGVAVADVNKDGKMDILNGEYWYEAPNWTKHELQTPVDHGTGEKNYSRVFACWSSDLNADGYPDLICIDFPGKPCYWLENPKGDSSKLWAKHVIWHSACNETPLYQDLFGNGKNVLIMGFQPAGKKEDANEGQMAYFTPDPKDPNALWIMHPISAPSEAGKPVPGTFRFSHGLGVGDVNGDGKNDVLSTGGWWEQPTESSDKPWKFHAANLGEACADMFVVELEKGQRGILSTSAHKFGIWFHSPVVNAKPNQPAFSQQTLFGRLVSETHAAHLVDIDGDGMKDLVTGKRWWSHGRSEPGHGWNANIYWLKAFKERDGTMNFKPMLIDDDCGVGTQFSVTDINGDGLLDIAVSNKRGVRIILQERK